MKKIIFILSIVLLFSCEKKPKQEKVEFPVHKESAEDTKRKKEALEAQKEYILNRPPVGKVKIITDELGCKWITLTVSGMSRYMDNTPAYSVDIEHHPRCKNH